MLFVSEFLVSVSVLIFGSDIWRVNYQKAVTTDVFSRFLAHFVKHGENSNKPISLGYTIRKNISAKNREISQIATYRGMLWGNFNTCLHDNCQRGPWNSTSVNTRLTL